VEAVLRVGGDSLVLYQLCCGEAVEADHSFVLCQESTTMNCKGVVGGCNYKVRTGYVRGAATGQ
jgi:hypothetical protein